MEKCDCGHPYSYHEHKGTKHHPIDSCYQCTCPLYLPKSLSPKRHDCTGDYASKSLKSNGRLAERQKPVQGGAESHELINNRIVCIGHCCDWHDRLILAPDEEQQLKERQ